MENTLSLHHKKVSCPRRDKNVLWEKETQKVQRKKKKKIRLPLRIDKQCKQAV